jgi:hypothetical protein
MVITTGAAGLAVAAYVMYAAGFTWVTFVVLMVLGISLALFPSLSVVVEDDVLKLWFGPGVIRRTFPLRDIDFVEVVRNRWYWGWGIRWSPRGWLYNVSGLDAVELLVKNGKRYRIGTDDPQALAQAIQEGIERTRR